jgi:uncharacterized protein YmfQ (DUF2313 family)
MSAIHDSEAYQDQLLRLLPPGLAWNRDPASNTGLLALGLADEFARIDGRFADLEAEAIPATADETIPDWFAAFGLPDPAIPAPEGLPAQQTAIVDRLTSRGLQTGAFYIALAAVYGYRATITNHVPFAADVGSADSPLYDQLSIFWWEMNVTVPEGTATPIVALEHAVRRVMQLHLYVTFNYVVA